MVKVDLTKSNPLSVQNKTSKANTHDKDSGRKALQLSKTVQGHNITCDTHV